jgi:hypothetical protein
MRNDQNRSKKAGFIDRRLYRKIIVRCAMHWVVFVATAGLLGLMIQFCVDPFAGWKTNFRVFWAAFGPTVAVSICLVPVFINDFLKLAHRSVGPLVRARSALQAMADGKLPQKVVFRDEDFNRQIADDLNAVIEMLAEARGDSEIAAPATNFNPEREEQSLELESVGQ